MVKIPDFEKGLNKHGYAFHHRLLGEILRLGGESTGSIWKLMAVEMPVVSGGSSTHIDFVLGQEPEPWALRILVGECKRVNPGYSRWCFARAPHVSPAWAARQVIAESIFNLFSSSLYATGLGGMESDRCYQIGFVMSSDRPGDSHPVSNDKDAIEKACAQVMKGVNGLVNMLIGEERLGKYLESKHTISILPAVFTTADLFATDVDLQTADLETGDVSLGAEDPTKVDWLYYQYPQTPLYKHSTPGEALSGDVLADLVGRDFVRTIAIVSPRGLKSFLESGWLARNPPNPGPQADA
jgi:hypothetical protein